MREEVSGVEGMGVEFELVAATEHAGSVEGGVVGVLVMVVVCNGGKRNPVEIGDKSTTCTRR